MTEYTVVFEQADDGGWSAYIPDIPGVVASADTKEQVQLEIREALRLLSEELASRGEPCPDPGAHTGTVSI